MKKTQVGAVGLLLVAALTLGGCADAINAAGNQARENALAQPTIAAAEIANRAEATRQAVLAPTMAALEAERERRLQDLTLSQQTNQQIEEHLRQMAIISATYAYSMTLIEAEYMSRTATITAGLAVVLADAEGDTIERMSEAFGKQSLNTGIGLGGFVLALFLGVSISVGAFYYFRRRGMEVRPDRRTGRLPILDEGWLKINWNRTSVGAIKTYRPGLVERVGVLLLLRAGKITPDEARMMLEPKVEQLGQPQLELAAAQSADGRDAAIGATWQLTDRDGTVKKSLAERVSQRAVGLFGAVQGAWEHIPMPMPKVIDNPDTLRRLTAESASGDASHDRGVNHDRA